MVLGGASMGSMTRRTFGAAVGTLALSALPARAKADGANAKLKIGVLLPRSGLQALIGQSCQKGADLAPDLIRQRLGVDIEIMNADTESNVDTARSRAERLIGEGAHVLVGAFDSGHTAAIAQVAEQHGVPHIVNIAAAPADHRAGLQVRVPQLPPAPEIGKNGLVLLKDIFAEAKAAPKTAVFMHVNDTFGQSMAKGVAALLPTLSMPFKLVDTIPYDPAAKDLTVEVSKAKATNAELLLLVCSAQRRDRLAARDGQTAVEPDGRGQSRFARALRGTIRESAGEACPVLHLEHGLVQSEERHHAGLRRGVQEAVREGRPRVSRDQRDLHVRRDPDRGGRVQTRQDHPAEGAGGGDSADQHRRNGPRHLWRTDQIQRQGSGRREPVGRAPEPGRQAHRRSAQGAMPRRSSCFPLLKLG